MSELTITPREKTMSGILFILMILLFMVFVIAVALAEYETVDYAKEVVRDIPTYLVFALVIIVLYLVALIATRAQVEKVGVWKYS
ncbi:MAG: hypothetical protein QXE81_04815 [Desulfurococcaceae archaeon]